MCVKEFLGYICGHCSIPTIRQCPLSFSNPTFPTCKFPAERPIFTNGFCHPCSRIVWNMNVLKQEEAHREQHLAGECLCEVIFQGEDREKRLRLRPRPANGHVKQVTREGDNEPMQQVNSRGGGRPFRDVSWDRMDGRDDSSFQASVSNFTHGGGRGHHTDEGIHNLRNENIDFGNGVFVGHASQKAFEAGLSMGGGRIGQDFDNGIVQESAAGPAVWNPNGFESMISGMAGLNMHAGQLTVQGTQPRQVWDPAAQQAAYQYVGYVLPEQPRQEAPAPEAGYGGAVVDGHYPQHLVWGGQTMIGQPSAGMIWHAEDPDTSAPSSPRQITTSPVQNSRHGSFKGSRKPRVLPKACAEGGKTHRQHEPRKRYQTFAESVEDESEQLRRPAIVSSGMARPSPQ